VRVEWTPAALSSAARFFADQPGMRALNAAIAALADDPEPAQAYVRGEYRRLRAGDYRVMYALEENLITVLRVDRLS
jgi:mRNA-degrading endonuclease RelE of RelBE toxin-antitoxin system